MPALWKPMLAAKPKGEDLGAAIDSCIDSLHYPVLASPKYDGIRCTIQNGKLYSRSLKLIPNRALQARWGRAELNGLDGEIIVGPPTAQNCFQRTTSCVMSEVADIAEETAATFYVFDKYDAHVEFRTRIINVVTTVPKRLRHDPGGIVIVEHEDCETKTELLDIEAMLVRDGYEGVIVRDPRGYYKQGRSTIREEGLVAVKRFVDAEAVVVDVFEMMHNDNAAETNELGRTKRSSAKAGKSGMNTLGGFVVQQSIKKRGQPWGPQFNIGTGVGLTASYRKQLWERRNSLKGMVVKFRYQAMGTKDAPRLPIFLGFRSEEDM